MSAAPDGVGFAFATPSFKASSYFSLVMPAAFTVLVHFASSA